MKASILRTLWIMFRSGLLIAGLCIKVILGASFGRRLGREELDAWLRTWAKKILAVINVKVTTHNPHQVDLTKPGRYILMGNHCSLYDIPVTFHALPGSIRMVAKKELFRIPLFGHAMRAAEVPLIDRQNRKHAIKQLQIASKRLDDGIMVWVYPEGTRSADGNLARLKKGGFIMAIESEAKIIPIIVRGTNKILPANTWRFHLNQKVDVMVGEPVDASDYSLAGKETLIAEVEKQMRAMLEM